LKKLDVGCGDAPRGDVNCDLHVGRSPDFGRKRVHGFIEPKHIPNFVRCSANDLPFRDGAFEEVSCHGVLVYRSVDFTRAFFELVRVASRLVEFTVPHRFRFYHYRQPTHAVDRAFNVKSLDRWLRRKGFCGVFKVSKACFPHEFICLIRLPRSIFVSIRLGG